MNIISRKSARVLGLPRSFTGKPCKSGNISPRFTSNTVCELCIRSYQASARGQEKLRSRLNSTVGAAKKVEYNHKYQTSIKGRLSRVAYINKRKALDPIYNLSRSLHSRLSTALKSIERSNKETSATKILFEHLGCTKLEFKLYIETLLQPDMTWDNHGKSWHLDHIKALGLFDLSDPAQLAEAVHYTNLQPLSTIHHKEKTRNDTRLIRGMQ